MARKRLPKYSVGEKVRIDKNYLPSISSDDIGEIVKITPYLSYLIYFTLYESALHTGDGFGVDGHYWYVPEARIIEKVKDMKHTPNDGFWVED